MRSIAATMACFHGAVPQNASVLDAFFGYTSAPVSKLSVLNQMTRVETRQIHINAIFVDPDVWAATEYREVDAAIQRARDIYSQSGLWLGIGRVARWSVPRHKANDLGIFSGVLTDDSQAEDLADAFSAPIGGLDVFFVRGWAPGAEVVGRSAVGGSCDKSEGPFDRMTGAVVTIQGNAMGTGRTLAHELGHYLGLSHEDKDDSPSNLMVQSKDAAKPVWASVALDGMQMVTILEHCFVRKGCP